MKAQIWMPMEWIVNLGEAGEVGEQDQSIMCEIPKKLILKICIQAPFSDKEKCDDSMQ